MFVASITDSVTVIPAVEKLCKYMPTKIHRDTYFDNLGDPIVYEILQLRVKMLLFMLVLLLIVFV